MAKIQREKRQIKAGPGEGGCRDRSQEQRKRGAEFTSKSTGAAARPVPSTRAPCDAPEHGAGHGARSKPRDRSRCAPLGSAGAGQSEPRRWARVLWRMLHHEEAAEASSPPSQPRLCQMVLLRAARGCRRSCPPPALPRCGPEPAAIQRLPRSRGRAETKPGLQNQAANGDGSLPRGLCRRFGRILRRIWALSTSFGGGEEDEEGDEHCVHRVLSALRAQHLACALRCTLVTWRARHSACSLHSPLVMFCAHHGARSSRCMFTTSQALHVCLLGTFQARCSACSPRCMLSAPRIASAQPQGCSSPAQAKDSAGAERPATALLLRSRHVFGGCLTRLCRVLTFCCLRSPPAAGTGAGHVLKAPAAVLLSRSEPGDKAATSR